MEKVTVWVIVALVVGTSLFFQGCAHSKPLPASNESNPYDMILRLYDDRTYRAHDYISTQADAAFHRMLDRYTEFAPYAESYYRDVEKIHRRVKRYLAMIIAKNPSERFADKVTEGLSDNDPVIRAFMAKAAGTLGKKSFLEPLKALTSDDSSKVRSSAIEALGLIGAQDVAALLVKATKDYDSDVRYRAAEAMSRVTDADESVVLSLVDLLRDPDTEVQQAAVRSLGELGSVCALKEIEKLMTSAKECHIFAEAAVAIGKLGDRRVVQALLYVYRDIWTLKTVREVLEKLTGSDFKDGKTDPDKWWCGNSSKYPDQIGLATMEQIKRLEDDELQLLKDAWKRHGEEKSGK